MTTDRDSPVLDGETLYRAVANDPRYLPTDAQGNRRISSTAFNDASRRPSVERAVLCPGGVAETRARFSAGSGVLSLVARDVRALTATHGATGATYGTDVEPAPLPDNPAHAEIFGRPPSTPTASSTGSNRPSPASRPLPSRRVTMRRDGTAVLQ